MKTETLKDVLNWTSEFHLQLSASLKRSINKSESERAQMLLGYLAEHEQTLAKVVDGFEKSGSSSALSSWCYDYNDQYPALQLERRERSFAELSTGQIIEATLELHEEVIALYRYLLDRADTEEARQLLQDLESLEEHEAMRMAHSANRLEDI